jgi:hypothetical protein
MLLIITLLILNPLIDIRYTEVTHRRFMSGTNASSLADIVVTAAAWTAGCRAQQQVMQR